MVPPRRFRASLDNTGCCPKPRPGRELGKDLNPAPSLPGKMTRAGPPPFSSPPYKLEDAIPPCLPTRGTTRTWPLSVEVLRSSTAPTELPPLCPATKPMPPSGPGAEPQAGSPCLPKAVGSLPASPVGPPWCVRTWTGAPGLLTPSTALPPCVLRSTQGQSERPPGTRTLPWGQPWRQCLPAVRGNYRVLAGTTADPGTSCHPAMARCPVLAQPVLERPGP